MQSDYRHMSDNYNVDLAKNIKSILTEIGEDPQREGLIKTPERVAKSMSFLTNGYKENPSEILTSAMFAESYSQMVLVKDIELYSLCEHHMLPFFGKAHIAYISNGTVVGLSKMNRVVDYFSKRPQVQERLTMQVVKELQSVLNTDDVACVIDAKHLCVNSRGIKDTGCSTITSEFGGAFKKPEVREEFLKYIQLETSFEGL